MGTKYCEFKSYMHGTPPAGWSKEYYCPMIGDNDNYFNVPLDNTLITLLAGKVDGYDSVIDCIEAIGDAIGYLPDVKFDGPYVSADSFDDQEFIDYVSMLSPRYENFIEYTPGNRYYSPTTTSDYGMGNIALTSGVGLCAAFMKYLNQYPQGGENKAYMVTQGGFRRLEWEFTIFPFDVFRTGSFDFSTMIEAPSHPGNQDWKRYCNIRIQFFRYPSDYEDEDLQDKWNASVIMYGYDSPIDQLNLHYQGTGTKVYDDGKAIADPPKKDDPQGDGTRPSDNIPIPNLPGADMTSSGSLRIYTLTSAQVAQIIQYLHSHDPAAAVLKWWSNPIQAIISLHYLPYPLKHKGNPEELKILGTPTGITGLQPAEQFQTIHFGYLDLTLDSGTYLDYSPYTKVSIYLPGIGIRELNVDDLMNKRIWVVYHCDNVTGQFVAFVATSKKGDDEDNASVKYTYSGQVAASFPISQENWGNTYIAGATLAAGALAMGISGACAGAAAGGGAAAGEAAGTAAAASETGSAINIGNVAGGVVSVGNSLSNLAKPSVSRSGAVTGVTSLFSVKKPYLIIESPNYYSFEGFDSTKGYPYGLYMNFKSLKGYAVIEGVHLTGIPATVTELAEIESLLKSGVHF